MMMMKKMRQSMILRFFLVIVAMEMSAFAFAGENVFPPPKTQGTCNYTVTIQTTCSKGADTSNHISLRFGDTNSNDVVIQHLNTKHMRQVDPLEPAGLDDVPKIPFQACTVDEFQVTGPCVDSTICYLYLKSLGNDAWRPGLVQVRGTGANHLSSKYFYFHRYLPRHVWHGLDLCDGEVSPFGIKIKRKVFSRNTMSKH